MRAQGMHREANLWKMVANVITEEMIRDGERLVKTLDSMGFDPKGALWYYSSDADSWKLVLVFSDVGKLGPKFYYEKVQRALTKMKKPWA